MKKISFATIKDDVRFRISRVKNIGIGDSLLPDKERELMPLRKAFIIKVI